MSAYFESLNRRSRPSAAGKATPAPVPGPDATAAPTRGVRPVERPVAPPAVTPTRSVPGTQYVVLRERLLVAANGRPLRVIVFAGCEGGEGSAEIVRDFAESLASSGLNILLLDAGVGRDAPSVDDLVHLVGGDGVGVVTPCGRGKLTVVAGPAGTVDKEQFYRSAEFASWLDRQRGSYDYALIDAPPIMRFADGMLLGRLCDGVVIVVEARATSRDALVRSREQLERGGVKVIGAVLNRVRQELPAVLRPYFSEE